jgi:MFS family permease
MLGLVNRPVDEVHHPLTRPGARLPARRRSNRGALVVGVLGTFVAMVTYAGPLANVPTVARALHAGAAAQTWLLSAVSVALGAALLTAGSLADNYGRRRAFVGGCIALALGSLACGIAPAAPLFITGRVVSGIGAAGIIASSLGIVAHVSPTPVERARASGQWGAALGAGIALGPVATGLLDEVGRWRWFYLLLALAVVALAATAHARVAESRAETQRRVDVPGALSLTAALVLLSTALTEGRAGLSPLVVSCGVLAVALLVVFVVTELGRTHPMLDLRLFRQQGFGAATTAAFGNGAGVIGLMSFACTFFIASLDMSSLHAAVLLLGFSGTSAVSALLARRLPATVGGSRQLAIGLFGAAIGELLMLGQPSSSGWRLVPGLVVIGLASGILNAGLGRQAVATVPAGQAALGSGANNTARYIGSGLGITLVVLVARLSAHTDAVLTWDRTVLVSAAITIAAALTVLALTRGWRSTGTTPR